MTDQMGEEGCDSSFRSQETEGEKEFDVCLRCSKIIEFVPYKYLNKTFHAVCVLCDFCGRKLIAKPFVVEGKKIFCSDQCKSNFEGAAAVSITVTTETTSSPNHSRENLSSQELPEEDPNGESLMEALENIKEGSQQELTKLSQTLSPPTNNSYDPDRRTDYPRAQSPESQSPINGSRRSSISLSAMSESSFTSDGSSYDASKQPKKKILKNPHRVRRHSKNRVRWKLPGEEDSDTASLQSFDSLSTVSEFRGGRLRHNSIDSGSSVYRNASPAGFGPVGVPRGYYTGCHNTSSTSSLNVSQSSLSSNPHIHYMLGGSPTRGPYYVGGGGPRSMSTSSLPVAIGSRETSSSVGSDPSIGSRTHVHQSLSPLANSSAGPSPRRPFTSTPISVRHQSDSYLARPLRQNTAQSDIDMPLHMLRSGGGKSGNVKAGVLEDRAQVFKYPQSTAKLLAHISPVSGTCTGPATPTTGSPATPTSGSLATPSLVSPATPTSGSVFLDDDDANDYDHLSPIKKEGNVDQLEQDGGEDVYSDKDIDDALDQIGDDSDGNSHSSTTPSSEDLPPLPPPRMRRQEQPLPQPLPQSSSTNQESKLDCEKSPKEKGKEREEGANEEEGEGLDEEEGEGLDEVLFEDLGELNWQINQASQGSAGSGSSQEAEPVSRVSANPHGSATSKLLKVRADIFSKPILEEEDTDLRQITSKTAQDSSGMSTRRRSPIPPPVAPKPKHLRRRNADTESIVATDETEPLPPSLEAVISPALSGLPSPSHIYCIHDIEDVEDILPPPPEFAFPLTPESSAAGSQDQMVPSSDECLSSISNSTLVPEQDYATEAKVLDTEHSTDRDTSSTSSSPPMGHNRHSWSVIHQSKVKERSVHKNEESSSISAEGKTEEKPVRSESVGGQPKRKRSVHGYEEIEPSGGKDGLVSVMRGKGMGNSLAPAVPRKQKISLEIAITEGNLLKNPPPPSSQDSHTSEKTLSPGSPLSPTSRTRKVVFYSSSPNSPSRRSKDSNDANQSKMELQAKDKGLNELQSKGNEKSPGLKRVPSRPAPPPPVPAHQAKVSESLSPDETRVLRMMFPEGGKPPMMRPVVHNTQKHIEEMLSEIESGEERKTNPSSYGTCGKCAKSIRNRQELVQFDGLCYHVLCYLCATCRKPLQGLKIHKVKANLHCHKCYLKSENNLPSPNSGKGVRNQVSNFSSSHVPGPASPAGGQVTTV